jgi:outer membrane cobalamin receptor
MVLVDGVRANTFGGGYDFSRLSLADVDRIEIVRGPQSALFGSDAIGGVVQIVTKHGGRPRLDATLEGGSEKTSRLAVSSAGSLGAWSWGAGAERRASDGFAGVAPATGEHVTNDDMAARHASASAAWHARRGAELRADVSYAWNDRGFPGPFGTNPIGAYTAVDRLSRGTTSTLGTGVRFAVPLTHGERPVRQRVQVNYADFASDYTSAFGLSRAETRRISARTQTDATLARGVRLSAGAELTGERALSTFITGDDPTPLPVRRRVIGAFVETEMTRLERVALTMGLRAEHIRRDRLEANLVGFSPRPAFGVDSLVSVNPKVTAAYSLYDRPVTRRGWHAGAVVPSSLRLRAAAGTGIRPPDALEIAFTDNPSLKPERSRSGEAGVEAGLAGGVTRVSATAFFNHYDDLIVAVGPDFRDASRFRTDNISNAQARGLELAARTRTSWGLDANFTYTWLHSAILAVDRGQGRAPAPFRPGDPLLRRPRHQGSVDVALTRGRTTSFVQIGARGRALDVEPTFGTFGGLFTNPGYLVAHAGTAVRITRMLDLVARVGNVTNRRYEETLGFPAPGRTVMVGVRFAASR